MDHPVFTDISFLFISLLQLFDFDVEVKPILEVLVGKTVEQALLEVMEEEELANLRSQQRSFEELRNAELVEQQRLEEQERRHKEEKVKNELLVALLQYFNCYSYRFRFIIPVAWPQAQVFFFFEK